MRNLTLNEKINIKSDLSRYGIPLQELAKIDMSAAMFLAISVTATPAHTSLA